MTAPQPLTGYAIARRNMTAALKTAVISTAKEEDRLQQAVLDLLKAAHRPGVVWWHVPNGGKRGKAEAARFKRLGVLAGVADLNISLPGGRMCFMELKARKGRVSEEQEAFLAGMELNGHATAVCRNVDEAKSALAKWGAIRGGAVVVEVVE